MELETLKDTKFEDFAKVILDNFKEHPHINPFAIIFGKDKVATLSFPPQKDIAKNDYVKISSQALQHMVYKLNANRYYLIMQCSVAKLQDIITNKQDFKKSEALLIMDISKEDGGIHATFPFEIVDKKVIYGVPQIQSINKIVTYWNIFLESEGVKEHITLIRKNQKL
jgi:hypothetical protein